MYIIGEDGVVIDAKSEEVEIFFITADEVHIEDMTLRNIGHSYLLFRKGKWIYFTLNDRKPKIYYVPGRRDRSLPRKTLYSILILPVFLN